MTGSVTDGTSEQGLVIERMMWWAPDSATGTRHGVLRHVNTLREASLPSYSDCMSDLTGAPLTLAWPHEADTPSLSRRPVRATQGGA